MKMQPPKYALKFLRWFCREDYLEEIEGDLTEVFERQYEASLPKAKWKFTWSVIRYCRPEFIKSFKTHYTTNHTAMFRHNLLLTYRTFLRYKMSFFINLIGLSTGLACALLIYLWVHDELSVDKFHAKDEQLYQIIENRELPGEISTSKFTSGLTAAALAEDMPEVEYATTVYDEGTNLLSISGGENIEAKGKFVGANFFKMFSYELTQGDTTQVLKDENSMVISESLAKRLFGTTEHVVGKVVERKFDKQYQVSGVFKDVPPNSTAQFDFVLSFEGYQKEHEWATVWKTAWPFTYVLLKPGTDAALFNEKIRDFVKVKTNAEITHRTLLAQPYSEGYLYGNYENGIQAGGRITYVKLFTAIAVFMLLIACINFMNLSTAKASRRIKEVGVKKAVGAHRMSLVTQYLSESLLLALFSMVVAVLLAVLLLPQFNAISGKGIILTLDPTLLLSLLSITVFTGLIAGSYPAFYLSGFNPAMVLKNKLHRSVGELWTRRGLVVIQFIVSIVLITSVWVVYRQIDFVQNKHLGYNKDNVLIFEWFGEKEGNLDVFLTEIRKVPGVINASSTAHSMTGHQMSTYRVQWPGRDPNDKTEFEFVFINYGMLEVLGIEMKEGRSFSEVFGTDTAKVILNEAAIDFIGLSDPISKVIEVWGEDREIIGVAKNFHFESLHEKIKPLFFVVAPDRTWDIAAKLEASKERETIEQLQQLSQTFYPGFSFDYWFLDQNYQALYAAEQRVSTLSKYFAALAILISCLGLFGLAAFTAERRLKEIGIRKILGASDFGIVRLLSGDFTKMVLVAIVIALPVSYFIAKNWLEGFAYRIDLEWWFFIGAGLVALLIAWFTVGLQTVKAARVNPAECLKDE